MHSIDLVRRGGFAAALLAVCSVPASDGRAQTAVCTPTQTVSTAAAANGLYTTTLTCADTSAAAEAADYRHLHYNHRAGPGLDPAPRMNIISDMQLHCVDIFLPQS